MIHLDPVDALQRLILDLESTDATDERTAYQIAVNQTGHAALCAALAHALHLGGVSFAVLVAVALWAFVWEGRQYVRARLLGRRVRRRWDWATDAMCYGAGGGAWALSGGLWGYLAGLIGIVAAVLVAVMFWAAPDE
jgi:hypothetical protein